jgi:hypothetical protein
VNFDIQYSRYTSISIFQIVDIKDDILFLFLQILPISYQLEVISRNGPIPTRLSQYFHQAVQ